MFADLKEKAAGVDRKRIYTAAAALLVAGAAGHFMQRTAGGSGTDTAAMTAAMTASVSTPPAVIAPTPQPEVELAAADPVDAVPAATETAATDYLDLSDGTPDAPVIAMPDLVAADAPVPEPDVVPEVEIATAEPVTPVEPEVAPDTVPDIVVADAELEEPAEAEFALPEVTRSSTDPLLSVGEPMAPSVVPNEPADVLATASEPADIPTAVTTPQSEPETMACAAEITAEAAPGALVAVSLNAPCNPGELVAFEHAGLKFSEQLGPDGGLFIEIPAMVREGKIFATIDTGEELAAEVAVPDFDEYDRIALVWQGATGLQLHALEDGADYGEPGHLWAETPATPDAAISGEGGFVSVLGSTSTGYAADVYTYPAALMRAGENPVVSVEAEVISSTCGRQVEGWILHANAGQAPAIEPLSIAVPSCDAMGEYLVLKNLPVDLKLARN